MRKSAKIRIGAEGKRDEGKLFLVTEMSAVAAERWGRRAFQALAKSGLDVPDEIANGGLAQIASFGFRAIAAASTDEVDWLMEQLMGCVEFVPDPTKPEIKRGGVGQALFDSDIEEYATRLRLQAEAFEISLGFSMAAVRSMFVPTPAPTSQA